MSNIFSLIAVLILTGHTQGEFKLKENVSLYDVAVINNDFNVVTYDYQQKRIDHLLVKDGSVITLASYDRIYLYGFNDHNEIGDPFLVLTNKGHLYYKNFDCFTKINLSTKITNNFSPFIRPGAYLYPENIYSIGNIDYLIYRDNNRDYRWYLWDGMYHPKYRLMKIDNLMTSQPISIEKGTAIMGGFKGLVLNDTLYSVWMVNKQKNIFTIWKNIDAIVISKFVNGRWQKPKEIVNDTEVKSKEEAIDAFFKLKNNYYIIWNYYDLNTGKNEEKESMYIKSGDNITWGNKQDFIQGVKICSYQVSNDRLHMIIQDKKTSEIKYITFDGGKWEFLANFDGIQMRQTKLYFDSIGNPYMFYIKMNDATKNKDLYYYKLTNQ